MKSKKMKQGMSWLLCMVMLLSNNVTVLADETDSSGEGQTQDVSAEETEASTEEAGVTTELETEETVETTEQPEPVEEEQPAYNEAVQLRHEFKDENGNVISVVTADIQEGSFEADASAISMEVDTLTEEEDSYMQGLIRENLPEYTYLGDYVLYDVVFKVNGELTDPMKEIKLTYEGTGIDVQDIQDAVVCQYNVADPEVTDDKDSVTEIIQRDDMIRYMEENGEDTSKVDDHDLSEVVLNENGAADQISMEVRKSSIFGCYVEELSQETAFSQEVNGTTITVTAPEGAFPMDADQVSMAAAPLSEEQAAAVEEQLSAQAESQGQELKGYAAYDISLWANGEEIQPQKPVTVTMENTGLDVAETLTAFQVSDEDNSVSNIGSIDENGTVSMETAAVLPAGTAAFGEPEVQDEEKQNQEIDDALANETAPETPDEEVTDSVVEKQPGDAEEEVEKDSKEEAGTDTSIEEKDNSKVENEDTEKEEDTVKKETDENSETVKKEETDDHTDTIENDKTAEENKADDQEKTTANIEKTEETEKDRSYEASYSDDTVEISVTAEPGVLPENAKLEITPIVEREVSDTLSEKEQQKVEETNAAYEETKKLLEEKAEENQMSVGGFLVYDIGFFVTDEDGNVSEIEPNGDVTVAMEFADPVLPEREEGTEYEDVELLHIKESDDEKEIEVLDNADIQKNENMAVDRAEFQVDSFSKFVIQWNESTYKKPSRLPREIWTEDTQSKGVTINLFDYQVMDNGGEKNYKKGSDDIQDFIRQGINVDHALWFVSGRYKNTINRSGLNQNLVQNKLVDGYPCLNNDQNSGYESLSYLFDDKPIENAKSVHTDLNYLFKLENGYYTYDSDTNYAYYDQRENRFKVYNQSNEGFFPFTEYEKAGTNEANDAFLNSSGRNHYFGMTIETNFIQPASGKVDEDPMKFEFSGDDDVWVFIDGVKVLDIGGIHSKVGGYIDFSDGTVSVDGTKPTNIKALYEAAGMDDQYEWEGNTFADYSSHEMKFFYLERGSAKSNCMIKFNLQTVPKNTIYVGKQITNINNPDKYSDIPFKFQVYKATSADDTEGELLKNVPYDIYELTDNGRITDNYIGSGNTGDSGEIILTHNQAAAFKDIKATEYYFVKEVGLKTQEYNGVNIDGTWIKYLKDNTGDSTTGNAGWEPGKINESNEAYEVQSSTVMAKNRLFTLFKNRCSAYNKHKLTIYKTMKQGQEDLAGDEYFYINMTLNGEIYTGEYIKYDEDNKKTREETLDGNIVLKIGEHAEIPDLPSGTTYHIRELTEMLLGYGEPTYENGAPTIQTYSNSGPVEGISGTITSEQEDAVVTVINQREENEPVPHNKYIDYLGDGGTNTETNLRDKESYRLYLDVTGIPTKVSEPVDVILVLEASGSMDYKIDSDEEAGKYEDSRHDLLLKAVKTVVDTLKPEGSENRIAAVSFANSAESILTLEGSLNISADQIYNRIKNQLGTNGGTNYGAGLDEARKLYDTNDGRKKFVVFVSDGEPTYYRDDDGKDHEGGGNEATEQDKNSARKYAKLLSGLTGFYTVSVGGDQGAQDFLKELTMLPASSVKTYFSANSADALRETFETIAASITKQIGDVTITDRLSDYVEFIKGESGNVDTDSIDLKVEKITKNQDGSTRTEVLEEGENKDFTVEIQKKEIQVNFGSDYFLEKGAVYRISFNVKLTNEAYTTPMDAKGEKGTDYPGNETSEDKLGLLSNSYTKLRFKRVIDGILDYEDSENTYQKPVVQAPQGAKLIIRKQVENYSDFETEGGNPLKDDEFFINVESVDGKFQTTAILGHGEHTIILADGKTTYTIDEILPKEYKLAGYEVTRTDVNGETNSGSMEDGNQITVNPGETVTVTVKNTFESKSYFHNDDSRDNTFHHNPDKTKLSLKDMKKEDPQMDLLNAELGSEKD